MCSVYSQSTNVVERATDDVKVTRSAHKSHCSGIINCLRSHNHWIPISCEYILHFFFYLYSRSASIKFCAAAHNIHNPVGKRNPYWEKVTLTHIENKCIQIRLDIFCVWIFGLCKHIFTEQLIVRRLGMCAVARQIPIPNCNLRRQQTPSHQSRFPIISFRFRTVYHMALGFDVWKWKKKKTKNDEEFGCSGAEVSFCVLYHWLVAKYSPLLSLHASLPIIQPHHGSTSSLPWPISLFICNRSK